MTMSAICGRPICSSAFGLAGFDTDVSRDDDHYLSSKLKEIGFPDWNDPARAPCHTPMPAAKQMVMQYPPGTGLVLALFPQGFQVIPLYVLGDRHRLRLRAARNFLRALDVRRSCSPALFGCLAIYLMINPAKASYSVAPTHGGVRAGGLSHRETFCTKERQHRLVLDGVVGL